MISCPSIALAILWPSSQSINVIEDINDKLMKRAWQEQAENHRDSKKCERREGGHNHIRPGARDAAGAMCKYTFRTVSF